MYLLKRWRQTRNRLWRAKGSRYRRTARSVAAAALLASTLVFGACNWGGPQREVWAEVNGHPIYRDQVEAYYRRRVATGVETVSSEQALSLKLSVLNELIDNELLLERADKLEIVVAQPDLDRAVAALSTPYTAVEFNKKLSDEGLTPAALREQLRQRQIIDKLLDREITSRIVPSSADIEAYYNSHSSQFRTPETLYHLAQILVTIGKEPSLHNLKASDAVGPVAVARKVAMLEQELRKGEDFSKLAEEYSEDPVTTSGGGDMGFVPASSIAADPRLRTAVAAMRVGQLSGVVRDERGDFHILKLLGRDEAGQRPLSDDGVQKTIRTTLVTEREQVLKAAYLENLRNQAKVKDELAAVIVSSAGGDKRLR